VAAGGKSDVAFATAQLIHRGNDINKNLVKNGYIAPGLMTIGGVLLLSRAFTNTAINNADRVVMSSFGLLMIAVWGLAYLGAAAISSNIKSLAGAFALEKLVYVVVWLMWLSNNSHAQLYAKDVFAGAFYGIYGLNDFVFMVFFARVFLMPQSNE